MNLREIEVVYTDGTTKFFTAQHCALDNSGRFFGMIRDNMATVWVNADGVDHVTTSDVEIMPKENDDE